MSLNYIRGKGLFGNKLFGLFLKFLVEIFAVLFLISFKNVERIDRFHLQVFSRLFINRMTVEVSFELKTELVVIYTGGPKSGLWNEVPRSKD